MDKYKEIVADNDKDNAGCIIRQDVLKYRDEQNRLIH